KRCDRVGYDPRIQRQPMLRSRSRFGGVLSWCGVLKLAKVLSKLTGTGAAAGRCAAAMLLKVSSKSTAAVLPVEYAGFGHSMVAPTAMAFRTRTAMRTRVRLRDMGASRLQGLLSRSSSRRAKRFNLYKYMK